jgi:PHD/YefM family antitoxin component YafN of YafNO toxin-antitoxin module
MIDLRNIRPLSDFQRNAKAHIKRLKRTGKPEVLTVNGEAQVVVQDAASYQKLLDQLGNGSPHALLREGLAQADRGEGRPMRQVLEEIAAKAGIRLKR